MMKLTNLRIGNFKCFTDTGGIELDQINLLIGNNNSGKSAVIKALHLLQTDPVLLNSFINKYLRFDENQLSINYHLKNIDKKYSYIASPGSDPLVISLVKPKDSSLTIQKGSQNYTIDQSGAQLFHSFEPDNFLYTYLSKRKVTNFNQIVNIKNQNEISDNLSNLVSKVARLSNPTNPRWKEYDELCQNVLGFTVTTHASQNGQQAGISVGDSYIPLEEMGEGVADLLGLITDLCMADGNLFLIEEPENDLHPEALKAILEFIWEKAESNQFVISTHSNIVVKYLGAHSRSKLLHVAQEYKGLSIPTSSIKEVDKSTPTRIQVLRQLGYELYDFDTCEGWLILEESSAQSIIQKYLVPWFAPKLSRIQIVSARGNKNVEATFNDFNRLFLFAHLEQNLYLNRAWVIVDGDDDGKKIVDNLHKKFSSWSPNQFRTWKEADFESYYPDEFASDVADTLSCTGNKKREKKIALLKKVLDWCAKEQVKAEKAFQDSAKEVIEFLQEIEAVLFKNRETSDTEIEAKS